MKRFFVLLAVMICLGVNVYASNICTVLDANGKATTDTITVGVSSSDNTKGTVGVVISSDSDKPVNAYITIKVDGKVKIQDQSIRIDPFMSDVKTFNIGPWTKTSSVIVVDISGAKCLTPTR
jgi:hypothetical protein